MGVQWMYYRKKTYVVAWQNDGYGYLNAPKWLKEYVEIANDKNDSYIGETIGINGMVASIGQYIVLSEDGDVEIYDPQEFNYFYEKL